MNHDAFDPAKLARAGVGKDGHEVFLNRAYVEADRRIVLGFVEPHFMAGFSGGYKGIFPGVADIASIMRYHDARMIGDPRSTWGLVDGNPTQERIRHDGALIPVDFCVNVTLNRRREITAVFCGDVSAVHQAGCAFSRETAMVACDRPLPIVVTTNSGYPLDQNLYQAVKGMSAAAQVVADGGYIVTAARCNDGFPQHGNFRQLLFEHASPQSLLDTIMTPGFSLFDQWQAQLLARILIKARVGLHSELPAEDVRRAHLEPVEDVERALDAELTRIGRDAPVAVLPEGPMTIPYVGCELDFARLPLKPEARSLRSLGGSLTAPGSAGHDRLQLLHPLGQRRRPRLEDVRGLDLVDLPVPHGRELVPSSAGRDLLAPDRLAAPRPDDDVRRCGNHLLAADDALLRQPPVSQFGKHRVAAGHLHQLVDPADPGDERVVPLLEVDARPARKAGGLFANAPEPSLNSSASALALVRTPDNRRPARGSSAGSRRRCAG